MAEIKTYSGIIFTVDDDLLESDVVPGLKVKDASWLIVRKRSEGRKGYYPYTNPILEDGSRIWKSLLALITHAPGGKIIHKNGDQQDFRKENLEVLYGFHRKPPEARGNGRVRVGHCPHTEFIFRSHGERNQLCERCNLQDIRLSEPRYWYDKCLDLACEKNWKNWVPHENLITGKEERPID